MNRKPLPMSQQAIHDYDVPAHTPTQVRRQWTWVCFGIAWAVGLLMVGLFIWDHQAAIVDIASSDAPPAVRILVRLCAVFVIAAAQFVFLAFVADSLFPRAPLAMRGFLKLACAILVYLSLALIVYLLFDLLR